MAEAPVVVAKAERAVGLGRVPEEDSGRSLETDLMMDLKTGLEWVVECDEGDVEAVAA